VIAALAFGLGIWGFMGEQKGAEYFAGYLLEQSLSGERAGGLGVGAIGCQAGQAARRVVGWRKPPHAPVHQPQCAGLMTKAHVSLPAAVDNLFVFILVFNYFKTPVAYQNKVLTYGIATAAVLRLVLIVAGVDIGGWAGWVGGWVGEGFLGVVQWDLQLAEAGAAQQSISLPSRRRPHP
jgi:hypothetical protein